ncbi:MAG: antitoxin [Acidobacteria bacterium]|nr:MAG: antitoxin [Acidobacteriota bacterium]
MRTTLKIDDDVLQAARNLATVQEKTVGEVISQLARRGLAPRVPREVDRQFPVFEVADEAAPLTSELVRRSLDDAE